MRWSTIFTLLVSLFLLGTLAAPASGPGQRDAVANLQARQDTDSTTTTENAASEASTTTARKDATTTATEASTATEATTTGTHNSPTASMNATTTATAASATSTVPSLDGATASSQQQAAGSTRPTYSGGLPIQPKITPAFGVGGFILMALGAILSFIGVRKQWYGMVVGCSWETRYANIKQGPNLPLNRIPNCIGSYRELYTGD
jgi:cobalamin biosynthesis Mg chelatase CobN